MADDDREREIEARFWKALKADRTAMLGLPNHADGHAQPMTAFVDDEQAGRRPIWFFTAKDTDLARALGTGGRGMLHFAAKDHALFASVEGGLFPDNDRATVERLWNPFVAAWYEGGKLLAKRNTFDDFIAYKGEAGAKEAGKWRLEGKEYIVKDGDVMHFRFNV